MYLLNFSPTSIVAGILGNFYFYCQNDKNLEKQKRKNLQEDAGMVKVLQN
jgi:hypothetical protein